MLGGRGKGASTARRAIFFAAATATLSVGVVAVLFAGAEPSISGAEPAATAVVAEPKEVTDEDLATFVQAAEAAYPEVSEDDAVCIGKAALTSMTISTIGMLLIDEDAPLKATADEQRALSDAIDDCIDRATAVQVIVGSTARMASPGDPFLAGPTPRYNQLACIDDELGELRVGQAFYDLYRRPIGFQQLVSNAMSRCLDEEQLRTLLYSWLSFGETPLDDDRLVFQLLDSACSFATLDGRSDEEISQLTAQMIIAASPDHAGDQLAELDAFLSACGNPIPRDFGRGS